MMPSPVAGKRSKLPAEGAYEPRQLDPSRAPRDSSIGEALKPFRKNMAPKIADMQGTEFDFGLDLIDEFDAL